MEYYNRVILIIDNDNEYMTIESEQLLYLRKFFCLRVFFFMFISILLLVLVVFFAFLEFIFTNI